MKKLMSLSLSLSSQVVGDQGFKTYYSWAQLLALWSVRGRTRSLFFDAGSQREKCLCRAVCECRELPQKLELRCFFLSFCSFWKCKHFHSPQLLRQITHIVLNLQRLSCYCVKCMSFYYQRLRMAFVLWIVLCLVYSPFFWLSAS